LDSELYPFERSDQRPHGWHLSAYVSSQDPSAFQLDS
jgi:hypothetical protein